jgi:hypothetical protein
VTSGKLHQPVQPPPQGARPWTHAISAKQIGGTSALGLGLRLDGREASVLQHASKPTLIFIALVGCFLTLQLLLPLSTAVKIGADEDFELSKVPLVLHGYNLYTDVWSDQPPLYAFLLTQLGKHFSYAILYPRLLTVGSGMVLLASFFVIARRLGGLVVAALATAFVIASPGFVELSCSAMLEIPALAPVVAGLCVLLIGPRRKWRSTEVVAGLLFAVGLQVKLIGVVYLPLALLILWGRRQAEPETRISKSEDPKQIQTNGNGETEEPDGASSLVGSGVIRGLLVFGVSVVLGFLAINWLTGAPLVLQLQLAWGAHFASAQSLEYGSPGEHGFEWMVLVRNWDVTGPAVVGLWLIVGQVMKPRRRDERGGAGWEIRNSKLEIRNKFKIKEIETGKILRSETPLAVLAVVWLGLTLVVFSMHKPWWAYYYVHNSLPLCLCAGFGFAFLIARWRDRGRPHPGPLPRGEGEAVGRRRRSVVGSKGRWGQWFRGRRLVIVAAMVYALGTVAWMGGRVYLQVDGIRHSPKLYASLVLKEIERFKPFTTFMFTDQPVYSFHSGIPVPPHLAIISLKRFWTGDMTNARLVEELKSTRPGLMLLANDTRELPFQELLDKEYRLVYQDNANRLYAHESISRKAKY